jgi:hypothetical protein
MRADISKIITGVPEDLLQGISIVSRNYSKQDTLYYIQVIHKTLFDISLDQYLKINNLKKVVNQLLVALGDSPLRLFELFPEKYLLQILLEIHMLGIDIEPLLKAFKLYQLDNGLSILKSFGDYSDDKFIDSLLYFCSKLNKNRYQNNLTQIAISCAIANNLRAIQKILPSIHDTLSRISVYQAVFSGYLEQEKFQEAESIIKLVESSEDKASFYSELTENLLKAEKYDDAIVILRSQVHSLVKFAILVQIVLYYYRSKNMSIIDLLIDELIDLSKNIEDKNTQTMCIAELAQIEMILERPKELKIYVEEVFSRIENILDFEQGCKAFNYLFTTLIFYDYFAQANDILIDRWGGTACNGQSEVDPNHMTDVTCATLTLLKEIKKLSRVDEVKGASIHNAEIKRLYVAATNSIYLLDDNERRDYLLHHIALCYAENRFYDKALKIREKIKDQEYKNYISSNIPIIAIKHGKNKAALDLSAAIDVTNMKIETQLIISPQMAKKGYIIEANKFVENWIDYLSCNNNMNR